MSSAGIVRFDSVLAVLFAKRSLFPNLSVCTLFVWTCFFIATIWKEASSCNDPLPSGDLPHGFVKMPTYRRSQQRDVFLSYFFPSDCIHTVKSNSYLENTETPRELFPS